MAHRNTYVARFLAALLTLCLPGGAALGETAAPRGANFVERRDEALRATRERRWSDALPLWRALDAERSGDARVAAELGWALLETGQAAEARRQFRRASHLDASNLRARAGLVRIAIDAHRLDDAVDLARETVRANPDSAEAFVALGDAQKAAARRSEAEDAYRRAVSLDPGNVQAQAGLGAVLLIRGKVAEAVKAWRAAAQLDPLNADHHESHGRAAMLGGLYGEAASAFLTAMDLARRPTPDWSRLDALALVAIDALSRAASATHNGGEPRETLFDASRRLLALTDALLDTPGVEDADPVADPAMSQRALAYGLMGQAAASDLAALRKDSKAEAADAFVLREQARRAVVSARAGAATPTPTNPLPPAAISSVTPS